MVRARAGSAPLPLPLPPPAAAAAATLLPLLPLLALPPFLPALVTPIPLVAPIERRRGSLALPGGAILFKAGVVFGRLGSRTEWQVTDLATTRALKPEGEEVEFWSKNPFNLGSVLCYAVLSGRLRRALWSPSQAED